MHEDARDASESTERQLGGMQMTASVVPGVGDVESVRERVVRPMAKVVKDEEEEEEEEEKEEEGTGFSPGNHFAPISFLNFTSDSSVLVTPIISS